MLIREITTRFEQEIWAAELGTWILLETASDYQVIVSSQYPQTLERYPGFDDKITSLLAWKAENPGRHLANDTGFISAGPIGRLIPNLRHLHLTRDLSLIYTQQGRNPMVFKLYGIYSHEEMGTGTPASMNRQRTWASQIAGQ